MSPELQTFMWGYLTGAVTVWLFGLFALMVRFLLEKDDDK